VPPRLLLDTHILIRWLRDRRKLSRDQGRALEVSVRKKEPLAFSTVSLLEIAMLVGDGKIVLKTSLNRFFTEVQSDPELIVLPVTFEIAEDAACLGILRDPMDRAIAATARRHAMTLVTSDQRIAESGLVQVLA
jgi:PIN domain nuclease of toxin-antitoxin system